MLDNKKVIALGLGTAAALESAHIPIYHTGNGSADVLAQRLKQDDIKKPIFFPISAVSRRSIQKGLKEQNYTESICYKPTDESIVPTRSNYDLIIATSPMQAARAYPYRGEHTLFMAIGSVTAAALSELGTESIIVPLHPTEAALAVAVSSWLQSE